MDELKFTLEELRHTMMIMNAETIGRRCEICDSARVKLEAMIANESRAEADSYEKPVPEWMAKLGVTKIEVEKGRGA
jgi:hypothetical protein